MNSQTTALRVASILFGIFTLGHLYRALTKAEVIVAGTTLPMWPSSIFVIVFACLSIWMWRVASSR